MRGDRKEFKLIVGEDKNFNMLKHKVIEQPILGPPNFNKVFQVEFDDSNTAIGVFWAKKVDMLLILLRSWMMPKKNCLWLGILSYSSRIQEVETLSSS